MRHNQNINTILKSLVIGLLLFSSGKTCFSQSNTIYRYHFLHQTFVNPAISGSEFFPTANLSHQKQWMGIPDSPQTFIASTSVRMGNFDFYNPKMFINNSRLKAYERIGMGFGVYSDRNGPIVSRGLNMAYAYHLPLDNSRLSFGLGAVAEQSQLDETKWDPITMGDPVLGNSKESIYNFNANFGVFYYSPDYFAGIAFNNFLPFESKISPGDKVKQDILIQGGYLFGRMNDIKFEPVLNFRLLDYEKIEFDILVKMYIKHVHWLAVAYRSYNAIYISAGYKIGKMYIAYSYEANLSPVIKYNTGTHGLNIGINLGIRRMEGF